MEQRAAVMSQKIVEYIRVRRDAKLEDFDKKANSERKKVSDPNLLASLEQELAEKRQTQEAKYEVSEWLTDAAARAKQIQMVTHALKYTHPDARGSSLYAVGGETQPESYRQNSLLSTASLHKPAIDVVGNAAALDVAGLLQLEVDGVALIEFIRQGDIAPLLPIAKNEQQASSWLTGFCRALDNKETGAHKLSKQIYFPDSSGGYHLVAPLYSSSFAQALYERIATARFGEEAKEGRKAKRDKKFSVFKVVDYPNTAMQKFGGSNAQNISQLNARRNGSAFLLQCSPPSWVRKLTPPLKVKTVFSWHHFGFRAHGTIKDLRRFLEKNAKKTSTITIRERRGAYIDELMDLLVQYAASIQKLAGVGGWSASPDCRLHRAEQLWLDPRRVAKDVEFAQEREKNDWQVEIADRFALWLNHNLKSDLLKLGDMEHREWQSLLASKLRLLKDDLHDEPEVHA
ncbi:type I-F CRISPR-associated protein Csy1 [Desulfurivibrio alkaliphilus]|uniref:CRISPR-associated protein, Csy1 family n=1 Tax=Desulfurivibrio alkaliphilus (strain DSM 19089 / UNIQEM U267 / AHT2) TaxID=589865 RepID=D6Z3U7_DESAT|nr:type I-F CRISPR-associated protein Csy1 [Desulfurivibrio alkaliphilus]ADH86222.1 CRISPR-associated protein, Csy1 family [Desulfurivibrio alkaliphilus AHT 2]